MTNTDDEKRTERQQEILERQDYEPFNGEEPLAPEDFSNEPPVRPMPKWVDPEPSLTLDLYPDRQRTMELWRA